MTLLASTTSCKRVFLTQNHIKSFGKCALNISILETLMRIAMAKTPMNPLDFENIWERWIRIKDRKL